jgi:hypothetical protein
VIVEGFDASLSLGPYVGGLNEAGVTFVGRYVARTTSLPGKLITPAEAIEFAIANIAVFSIYEGPAEQSSAGTGKADGLYAASYLPTVGLLPNTGVIVYYAEDFNVQLADIAGISAAFEAFGAALPGYGLGVYSCGYCNAQLAAQGLIVRKWLSASTSYNGTEQAISAGDYDMLQGIPTDVTINKRIVNIDPDTVRVPGADIGARIPWNGGIPQDGPLSVVAIQMLLNKAGQTPPLAPDDIRGNLTDAAIIASKQKFGISPADTSIDWTEWVPRLCEAAGVKILAVGA